MDFSSSVDLNMLMLHLLSSCCCQPLFSNLKSSWSSTDQTCQSIAAIYEAQIQHFKAHVADYKLLLEVGVFLDNKREWMKLTKMEKLEMEMELMEILLGAIHNSLFVEYSIDFYVLFGCYFLFLIIAFASFFFVFLIMNMKIWSVLARCCNIYLTTLH